MVNGFAKSAVGAKPNSDTDDVWGKVSLYRRTNSDDGVAVAAWRESLYRGVLGTEGTLREAGGNGKRGFAVGCGSVLGRGGVQGGLTDHTPKAFISPVTGFGGFGVWNP